VKQLDPTTLQPADILLTSSSGLTSKAIRFATRSEISHAMIYVETHSAIDATADGVQARNIQREPFEDDATIVGLRLARPITKQDQAKICEYARQAVGSQYATVEALNALFAQGRGSRKEFCSRLAARAYAAAGIQLVENPDYCTPEALRRSPLLHDLGTVTCPLSDDDWRKIQETLDLTAMQRRAHNFILTGARQLEPAVQTLDDVYKLLVEHPEHDGIIANLHRRSGFLDFWKPELERNRWQYDLRLMNQLAEPPDMIASYCRSVISEDQLGTSRYITNHAISTDGAARTNLDTFWLLKDLYEGLAMLHQQRRYVAIRWLQAHGMAADIPAIAQEPVPNSTEWVASLAIWNPMAAALTTRARVAAQPGQDNFCSVCGDAPALEFRIADPESSPSPVTVFRFCDDCVGIRRADGERWVERFL
jgi:Permuted papain-like amidase enzyme, YaeF/YiiX, C92 family